MSSREVSLEPLQHEKNEEALQEEAKPVVRFPPGRENYALYVPPLSEVIEAAVKEYLAEDRAQKTPRATQVKVLEDNATLRHHSELVGHDRLVTIACIHLSKWFEVDKNNEHPDVTLTQSVVVQILWDAYTRSLGDLLSISTPGQALDAAQVHSDLIRSAVEEREKKRLDDAIQRLTELANAPMSFEPCTTGVDDPVTPQAAYAEFAGQLRAQGLDETSVFDLVAQLSKLIQQSEEILPNVTKTVVRRLEARVLLSYYRNLETEQAEKSRRLEAEKVEKSRQMEQKNLARESLAQAQDISAQLSSLNATAERQAKDTSTNTFLHLIDGLFGH